MSALRAVVAGCWVFLGASLVVSGVVEWWSSREDPVILASSLRWWDSTEIIPGSLAVVVGVLLWKEIPFARLAAFFLATVFSLYTIYIMLLTRPEHLVRPVLAVQILVLSLSAVTAYYAVIGLRSSNGSAGSG